MKKKAFVLRDVKNGGIITRAIWSNHIRSGDADGGKARALAWISDQFHAWNDYAYHQDWELRIEEQD